MDYNGNNNNNMNMQNPNMGRPGMPNQGVPNQGMPNQGMPGQGMPYPGMQNPNMGRPGMGAPNMGAPNMGRPGMPNQGMPGQGIPRPGMPNQGMPSQGMPRTGMPNMPGRPPFQAKPSQADLASSRLAREIEKSVNKNGDEEQGSDRPKPGAGIRRAGGPKQAGLGGLGGLALPKDVMEGISGFSAYIYGGILVLCLIFALIAYGRNHKGGGGGGKALSIPTDMVTYTGVFRNAYEAAAAGQLSGAGKAALYDDDGTEVPPAPTAVGEEGPSATDVAASEDASGSGDSDTSGGSDTASSDSSSNFGKAESYKELLDQIEKAISTGDTDFISKKMAYEDESGTLKAYPQTVIEHFVTYMSANPDKRSTLMTDLSSDKYSGQNDGEFIVKLPYIKFVVNMGYDNTTVSIPGFSDQVVNAGQSADIAPLMPCMYTLTISNPDWNDVVTRDIEANINESTISINIKP